VPKKSDMKIIVIFLAVMMGLNTNGWLSNFEEAEKIAKEKHQLILLNFSGSDWCMPCMKMKKEIFESDTFKQYADSNLVLVNADFPRKKNALSKEQTKLNEALADQYNKEGKFPYTILMTEDKKILKEWEGCPNIKPAAFNSIITMIKNENKY
jgi:thioredoxin-related protein